MNKSLNRTIFLCFELSIILFSFAPWLSVASKVTYYISRFLYLAIFLILLWTLIANKRYSKRGLTYLLISALVLLIYFFISFSVITLSAKFNDILNIGLPFLMCLILYAFNGISLRESEIQVLLFTFYSCVVINCIYGFIQVIYFSDSINGLYVSNIKYHLYDYYRNGRLRAFGFLSSPAIFSNYLGIALIPILFGKKNMNPYLKWGLGILIFIALYLTGSRIPFYSLLITFICINCFRRSDGFKLLISFSSIFMMLQILKMTSIDLSASGRLKQYEIAWNLVLKKPLGYGLGYASYPDGVINFDSGILDILVNFGLIFSLILIIVYSKLIYSNRLSISQKAVLINLFVLSGFVNTVHSGTLILCIILFMIQEKNNKFQFTPNSKIKIKIKTNSSSKPNYKT